MCRWGVRRESDEAEGESMARGEGRAVRRRAAESEVKERERGGGREPERKRER